MVETTGPPNLGRRFPHARQPARRSGARRGPTPIGACAPQVGTSLDLCSLATEVLPTSMEPPLDCPPLVLPSWASAARAIARAQRHDTTAVACSVRDFHGAHSKAQL
jgi:hypothetical protein